MRIQISRGFPGVVLGSGAGFWADVRRSELGVDVFLSEERFSGADTLIRNAWAVWRRR